MLRWNCIVRLLYNLCIRTLNRTFGFIISSFIVYTLLFGFCAGQSGPQQLSMGGCSSKMSYKQLNDKLHPSLPRTGREVKLSLMKINKKSTKCPIRKILKPVLNLLWLFLVLYNLNIPDQHPTNPLWFHHSYFITPIVIVNWPLLLLFEHREASLLIIHSIFLANGQQPYDLMYKV